ncbi:Aspartate--tRNA ligase [Pediococcus pentosaceus]|nr:Aspartate--tRNA ligase [Pediococcus pentosaceus]
MDIDVKLPFDRISWKESMDRFGTDQPDVRFGMELKDISSIVADSEFKVFSGAVANGGVVKAIAVPDGANNLSRKDIDKLGKYVERFGAKGLAWLKITDDGFSGPVAKFFNAETEKQIMEQTGAQVGDLLLFAADRAKVVGDTLGYLRVELAKRFDMIDEDQFAFLWVVDWPLFDYDEGDQRWGCCSSSIYNAK